MPSPLPAAEGEEDNGPALQDESDHAHEEYNELNTARQRPDEASGEGTTFTGLSGTARWGKMRSSPSTDQAAASPFPSQSPKTFTPNPTPLKASSTDLPDPHSSIQHASTSSPTPREFHLVIERSALNHQFYIQRQHYYGGFRLDLNSTMGLDLEGRVPVAGMADCQLGKSEVPLRYRMKQRQEEDERDLISLGSLWEEGEREREEAKEKEREGEADNKVGAGDGVCDLALYHAEHGYRQRKVPYEW